MKILIFILIEFFLLSIHVNSIFQDKPSTEEKAGVNSDTIEQEKPNSLDDAKTFKMYEILNLKNELIKDWQLETYLKNFPSEYLDKIKRIDLSKNRLTKIDSSKFFKYTSLEELDLSFNLITKLERSWFKDFKNLRVLTLQRNSINMIGSECFFDLNNMVRLEINGNNLEEFKSSNYFSSKNKLELLDLSNNSLVSYNLSSFTNLKQLYLSYNRLDLTSEYLSQLPVTLIDLNVAFNNVTIIKKDTFKKHEKLEGLSLVNTSLIEIEKQAFSGILNLRRLLLENNRLKSNDDLYQLDNLEKLDVLDLSNFGLNSFNSSFLQNNSCLRILSLKSNSLRVLNSDSFKDLIELMILNLNSNKLKTIETDTFKLLVNLRILNLQFNRLKTIDNLFQNLIHLDYLHLANNSLTSLNSYSFGNLKNLEKIFLNYNDIKTIHVDTFKDMVKLKSINLFGNKLNKIKLNTFDSNKKLKVLILGEKSKINRVKNVKTFFENLKSVHNTTDDLYASDIDTLINFRHTYNQTDGLIWE